MAKKRKPKAPKGEPAKVGQQQSPPVPAPSPKTVKLTLDTASENKAPNKPNGSPNGKKKAGKNQHHKASQQPAAQVLLPLPRPKPPKGQRKQHPNHDPTRPNDNFPGKKKEQHKQQKPNDNFPDKKQKSPKRHSNTKAQNYAGPSFSNSPSPDLLPLPSFLDASAKEKPDVVRRIQFDGSPALMPSQPPAYVHHQTIPPDASIHSVPARAPLSSMASRHTAISPTADETTRIFSMLSDASRKASPLRMQGPSHVVPNPLSHMSPSRANPSDQLKQLLNIRVN